ncbi:MAG: exosortase/archaeosortase family protein [Pseudomonadales bacterium]
MSASSPKSQPGLAGTPAFFVWLGLLAAVVVLCRDTVFELNGQWASANGHYNHGYLLLALGLYFVWLYRHALVVRFGGHSYLGVLILLAGFLLWQAAALGNVLLVQYVGAAVILAGLSLAVMGWQSLGGCLWRFAIVGFALPIWDMLNHTLQVVAGVLVGRLLALVGVPHHLENTFVTLPNGAFEIAGGCSGLGFLLTGLSLAFYLLATSELRATRVAFVVAISVAIALVTNWVRIAVIIYVGYRSDMTSSLVADHLWVGWLAFAILAFPVFLLLSSRLPQIEPPLPGTHAAQLNIASAPALATGLALAACVGAYVFLGNTGAPLTDSARLAVSFDNGAYRGCQDPVPEYWEPSFTAADLETRTGLCRGAASTQGWLQAAYYATESQGKELIFHKNDPIGMQGEHDTERRSFASGEVNVHEFTTLAGKHLIWHWYQVGNRRLAGSVQTKLAQIKRRLEQKSDALSVSLLIPCDERDCAGANATAQRIFESINLQTESPPADASPQATNARSPA